MAAVGITSNVAWNVYSLVGVTKEATWDVAAAEPVVSLTAECNPFQSVLVDYLVEGVSRIWWTLSPSFYATEPYTYQLQVGDSGNPEADDWIDVGDSTEDTIVLLDPEKRAFGTQLTTHYRIKLTDDDSIIYYSKPATVFSGLQFRDWVRAKAIIRKEKLRLKQFAGVDGLLLKRRRTGTVCPVCTNTTTRDTNNSHCAICFGTRYVGGYFTPMADQYADVSNITVTSERLAGPDVMTGGVAITGRFLGNPMLSVGDVWVDASSDLRFFVDKISVIARIRHMPVILDATLLQFAFDNIIYKFPLGE